MKSLVFVHGFMGGSQQWVGQRQALGDAFDIITPDLPGFGENAHLTAPDSITGFAQWVLDDLSTRGIEQFHIVGHSMGGMIVQEIVRLAPHRVAHMVLYGTGATGVLPGRFESISASKQSARADGPRITARRISATWFLKHEQAAAYEGCAAIAERSSPQSIEAGLDAMQNWSGVSHLPDIHARTLGDLGRQRPILLLGTGRAIMALYSRCQPRCDPRLRPCSPSGKARAVQHGSG